jgi:predicted esterase YcpF (UPF0227 family)
MLIYVHGFNSSALSFKAALLRKHMAMLRRTQEYLCPELPHRPRLAIELLENIICDHQHQPLALIGSSLGGYYATWLSERHGCRAVLVNPAVRPYGLLEQYRGPQTNLYTGERYELRDEHIAELRALEVGSVTPERYLLLVTEGDEVLDYRDALDRYAGCTQVIEAGGDHGFSEFERHVPAVLAFCGVHATPDSRRRSPVHRL